MIVTGDLVDGSVAKLHESADVIRDIQTKYGIYYVTGMLQIKQTKNEMYAYFYNNLVIFTPKHSLFAMCLLR